MNIIEKASEINSQMQAQFNKDVSLFRDEVENRIKSKDGKTSMADVIFTIYGVMAHLGVIASEVCIDIVDVDEVVADSDVVENYYELLSELSDNYNAAQQRGVLDFVAIYSFVYNSPQESLESEIEFFNSIITSVSGYCTNTLLPEFNTMVKRTLASKLLLSFNEEELE